MKLNSVSFFKSLFGLTIFLTGVAMLIANYRPDLVEARLLLLMILFVLIVISSVHLLLVKGSQGKPQKFIRVFMVTTMVKLLLYFVFILTLAFLFREQAASLLIGFLILYFCYTGLEVYFLRKHLNSKSI